MEFRLQVQTREGRQLKAELHARSSYHSDCREAPTIRLDQDEAAEICPRLFRGDSNATGYLQKHGRRIVETVELVRSVARR